MCRQGPGGPGAHGRASPRPAFFAAGGPWAGANVREAGYLRAQGHNRKTSTAWPGPWVAPTAQPVDFFARALSGKLFGGRVGSAVRRSSAWTLAVWAGRWARRVVLFVVGWQVLFRMRGFPHFGIPRGRFPFLDAGGVRRLRGGRFCVCGRFRVLSAGGFVRSGCGRFFLFRCYAGGPVHFCLLAGVRFLAGGSVSAGGPVLLGLLAAGGSFSGGDERVVGRLFPFLLRVVGVLCGFFFCGRACGYVRVYIGDSHQPWCAQGAHMVWVWVIFVLCYMTLVNANPEGFFGPGRDWPGPRDSAVRRLAVWFVHFFRPSR